MHTTNTNQKNSVEQEIIKIKSMTHTEMAKLYRFAPSGHVYFADQNLNKEFMSRFNSFGGMTPSMSKEIGHQK